ncbi:conserved domain protein [Clostridium sp. CAG:964]|jgi:transcriptional regulator with XRE-family HTH domain|nr:conserved domain protein [Clostridium sp. CAG:964]
MQYNEIIKQLREDRDLTQEQIATILNCSQTAYSKYEKGLREISIQNLIKLAKFYNVSMDYITGLTSNPKPNYITKNKIDINNNFGKINIK